MAAEADDSEVTTLAQRIARLVTRVLKQYVDNAKRELKSDVVRLFIGVAFLLFGGVLSVHMVIFAHITLVVVLDTLGVPLWAVVGGVFLLDAAAVLFCLLAARFLLFRPILPRTRKQVAEAWHFLVG